jgi:uncharacterized membrane protein YdbT with pleckstrin-like domain
MLNDRKYESANPAVFFLLLLVFTLELNVFLTTISTKLTITNKKTTLWHGIFTRTEVELLHSDIRSVVIRQGLLQRLLGVGTVAVATAATSLAAGITAFRFRNPDKIKKIIQQYQSK